MECYINRENKILKIGDDYFKIEGYHDVDVNKITLKDNIKFRKIRNYYVDSEVFDNGNITVLNTKDNVFVIDYFYISVWGRKFRNE